MPGARRNSMLKLRTPEVGEVCAHWKLVEIKGASAYCRCVLCGEERWVEMRYLVDLKRGYHNTHAALGACHGRRRPVEASSVRVAAGYLISDQLPVALSAGNHAGR